MTVALEQADVLIERLYQGLVTRIGERQLENPLVVGIHTGGAWVAGQLQQRLEAANLVSEPLGTLDISFYRDDFTRVGLNPKVKSSQLPLATDDRHIILVDDVVMAGRTIRAALNLLFEFGRPASVTLVALVDLQANELPIRPDIAGQTLDLPPSQRIKLNGPEPLTLEVKSV